MIMWFVVPLRGLTQSTTGANSFMTISFSSPISYGISYVRLPLNYQHLEACLTDASCCHLALHVQHYLVCG